MSPTSSFPRGWSGVAAVLTLVTPSWVLAGMSLGFEHVEYVAPAQTSVLELKVIVDGDTNIVGAQPVPNGLFSYGFVIRFDAARLQPLVHGAVTVEPALDHSGFAHGAVINRGSNFLTVKGNIDPVGAPYSGVALAVVRLETIGAPDAPTAVTIEVFEQSPSEAVFVDGTGVEIDPLIVPRPSAVTLLAPLRVEWIPGIGPVASHARLTYGVHAMADFRLESTDSLGTGTWQPLPGAPHNSGEQLDFIGGPRRFYRLLVINR